MKVETAERQAIFRDFPVLASALKVWQAEMYRPDEPGYQPGDSVWIELDDDQPTVLTESLAEELNREYEEQLAALKDAFEDDKPPLNRTECAIVELPANSFEDFICSVGRAFESLAKAMGWNEFAIISDCRRSIVEQDNDYPPVAAAQAVLMRYGLNEKEPHGLRTDRAGMAAVLGPLFWIARCNASAPNILVAPRKSSTICTLCKYGNFHVDLYDAAEKRQFEKNLPHSGLTREPNGRCHERFSDEGALEGRALQL